MRNRHNIPVSAHPLPAPSAGQTEARSDVIDHEPLKPGHGSRRTWARTIRGKRYSFTAILMPNGERRYAASRMDRGDGRFDSDWRRTGFWTVPAHPLPTPIFP